MLERVIYFIGVVVSIFRTRLSRRGWPLFAFISLCWMAILSLPYAWIGETWGMVWFYITAPFSSWAKEMWETFGATFYVTVVTLVDGIALFIFLNGGNWLITTISKPWAPIPVPTNAAAGRGDDRHLSAGA